MQELRTLVTRAQSGDWRAFEPIVQRFQDMAVGYGDVTIDHRKDAVGAHPRVRPELAAVIFSHIPIHGAPTCAP